MALERRKDDPRYADWYAAYVEDVRDKVKHWGSKRAKAVSSARQDNVKRSDLDAALFEPGR